MHFLCSISMSSDKKGHFAEKENDCVLKDPTLGDYILTWDFKHEHLHDLLHNILDSEMSLY